MAVNEVVWFLRARLDDDEAFMRAAIRLRDSGAVTSSAEATEGAFALMDVVMNDPDTAEAITVFTRTGTRAPGEAERVLAEVEAKRRIIELHRPRRVRLTGSEGGDIQKCQICDHFPAQYPCGTMRALTFPYADHPDYRQEWAA